MNAKRAKPADRDAVTIIRDTALGDTMIAPWADAPRECDAPGCDAHARWIVSRLGEQPSAPARVVCDAHRPSPNAQLMRAPHRATQAVVEAAGSVLAVQLYAWFGQFNRDHFGGMLAAPLIWITSSSSSRTLGDYCPQDEHGLQSRIRISPAAAKRGPNFVRDVLLHEMVHAWQTEIADVDEASYRGHGPRFAEMCNAIGKSEALGAVGVKGRDGLPDCKAWPMCVRPEGYYPVPFKPATRRERKRAQPEQPEPEPEQQPEPERDRLERQALAVCVTLQALVRRLQRACTAAEQQRAAAVPVVELRKMLDAPTLRAILEALGQEVH